MDDIPAVPTKQVRPFIVPAAPKGTYFYRKDCKRVLKEGQVLCDSEDDEDYDWIRREQSNNLDDFSDVAPAEKDFIKCWSDHVAYEGIASDVYLPASIERFAASNKAWLQQPLMRVEFYKLLAKYVLYGQIDKATAFHCLKIANRDSSLPETSVTSQRAPEVPSIYTTTGSSSSSSSDMRQTPQPSNPVNEAKPESKRSEKPTGSPGTPIPESHKPAQPKAICICGGPWDMSIMCACENKKCPGPRYYHLKCVGLTKRRSGWRCKACMPERSGTQCAAQ
ncbi:MAG: hypothetical protein M1814_003349 [Vezdaea aestivalis]|nr:MAG: hypothetical protein M1814_003349 [Vezdaea aestivalis]